ncbi:MAG: hypothetical protein J0H02_13055 [Armatimonadetes bacterium]|nr:hypothetical protein [Armatimonadota bacterium]
MRSLLLTPVLALCVVAPAQKQSDWKKSSSKALDVAKKVDQALYNLKNAEGKVKFHLETAKGRGNADQLVRIRDRKTFRIESVRVDYKSINPFTTEFVVSNNGVAHSFTALKGVVKVPAGGNWGGWNLGTGLVRTWEFAFGELIFHSYLSGKGMFQAVVSQLLKGTDGYDVRVEERTMQNGGKLFPQRRILAIRKPALAKKFGAATIEMAFDATMWLPLQVQMTKTPLKGVRTVYSWTCIWSGPKRFENKYFLPPKN